MIKRGKRDSISLFEHPDEVGLAGRSLTNIKEAFLTLGREK